MAENDVPADDLRSIMSAAFDKSMAQADPVVETKAAVEPKVEEVAAEAVDAKGETRERDASGKFVKKTEAEEKAETEAAAKKEEPVEKTAAKKEGEEKPDDKAPVDPKADPKEKAIGRWSPSDKAMFRLQPPEVQDYLLRRHSAMEADYTKKVEAITDLRKEFEPIQQMFAPHLDTLKQKGLTPASTIKAWANVETALVQGRGVDIVKGMIESYGIDKAAVARALGFTSGTASQPSTETVKQPGAVDTTNASPQPIALPPELQKELHDLRARLDAQDNDRRTLSQREQQAKADKVETDISQFKSAANEKGELLHPYFDEVEPAMIALAQSYVASKQTLPPLADLYDTAVWANPSTRAAVLASQKAADQTKANEEARAKAASARRAGSSVTGAPGSGQATRQVRGELTLREQLEEAAAEAS